MANKLIFNPITGNLDYVNADVIEVASDPVVGAEGTLYIVSGDPTKVWYFVGGNRYYLSGTLDNPIATGPWLSLAFAAFD